MKPYVVPDPHAAAGRVDAWIRRHGDLTVAQLDGLNAYQFELLCEKAGVCDHVTETRRILRALIEARTTLPANPFSNLPDNAA